jgi:hypothetical protein
VAEGGRQGSRIPMPVLVYLVAPVLFGVALALVNSGLLGVGGPEPKPPQGTLAYGGVREVGIATIGCWREKRRLLPDREVCIPSQQGVSLQEPRLRVPSGARMQFVYGGASAPKEIRARAYRTDVPPDFELAEEKAKLPMEKGSHVGPPEHEEQPIVAEQAGKRAEVIAGLPPGKYLIIVDVRVDDEAAEGEAYYDFFVRVE